MPPAVQPRIAAPAAPTDPKRTSRAAAEPPAEGTEFQRELVRRRKDKPKADAPPEPRAAPKAGTKPKAASKGARSGKPTKPEPSGTEPLPVAPAGEANATHAAATEETAGEGGTVETVPGAAAHATAEAGAAAVATHPLPQADAEANADTETQEAGPQAPSTEGALTLTEAHLPAAGPAEAAEDAEPAPPDGVVQDAPPSVQSKLPHALHPVETDDAAKEHDTGDHAAGEGSADAQAWARQWDSAPAPEAEAAGPPVEDVRADAPHPGRPGVVHAPELPALDLSAKHAGPSNVPAAPFAAAPNDALPAEARFAADNHDNIVKGIRAEALPNGGTMRIRLDPPQLGALQVTVRMRDGLVTASFETSSDEATKLLGHSLNQLKTVLESHGVAVDKLQVQQAPRDERPGSARDEPSQQRGQGGQDQEHAARQEQQRREMLRRMWRRLSGFADPLDVTG